MTWLERKRVILLNRFLFVAILLCLPFTNAITNPNTWSIVLRDSIVLTVLLYVNFKKHPKIAVWAFIVYGNLTMLQASLVTNYFAEKHVFFILLITMSPLILDFSKRLNVVFSTGLTVICYTIVHFYFWNTNTTDIDDIFIVIDHRVNLILLFIGAFVLTYNYFKVTLAQHQQLLSINENLRSKERDLKETMSKLKYEVNIKTHLLSLLSHEIRTPLNATLNLSEKLKHEEGFSLEQRESIDIINFSSNNIVSIVNDILDWSKIENKRLVLANRPFDIKELLEDINKFGKHLIEKNGKEVVFKLKIEGEFPDYVKGDATRLSQVLLNLIGNATKFTESGEIVVLVKSDYCSSELEEFKLHFEVSDTGIGIPKDKLADIFETFVQADDSIAQKYGGTGLGLSISKEIVGVMGGDLKVSSCEGLGSKFYFDYVVRPAKNISQEELDNDSVLKGLKVLVVDDNKVNIMVAEQCVGQWGMVSESATSGEEAIKKVEKQRYDIILMDISMPGMNGFEVTKVMKEEIGIETPILALAGFSKLTGENQEIPENGFDGLLSKPLRAEELKKKMLELIPSQDKVSSETSSV